MVAGYPFTLREVALRERSGLQQGRGLLKDRGLGTCHIQVAVR